MTAPVLDRPERTRSVRQALRVPALLVLLGAPLVAWAAEKVPSVDLAATVLLAVLVMGLLLAPRGLLSARSWVLAYLVMQFPVRAWFLLTVPEEKPPIYNALSPGTGLEAALVRALVESLVGVVVLLAVYLAMRPRARDVSALVITAELRGDRLRFLLAAAALLLPVELFLASSDAGGSGFIVSLPGLAASGACAAVAYAFVQQPGRYRGAMVLATLYGIARVGMLHSKLTLLACLVVMLVSATAKELQHHPGRSMTLKGTAPLLVATCIALYVFAASGGRTQGDESLSHDLGQGVSALVSRSYGVDALVATDLHLDAGGEMLHGESFVELAYSWVPRSFWPEKPKSFSIRFGEDVFSFSHNVGKEFFAPSYSGEWVLNFGLVGLVVGWALFGLVLAKVDGITSLAHRSLWLIPVVHLVEGSVVAQLWLAAPYLLGGYWVLRRPARDAARTPA